MFKNFLNKLKEVNIENFILKTIFYIKGFYVNLISKSYFKIANI